MSTAKRESFPSMHRFRCIGSVNIHGYQYNLDAMHGNVLAFLSLRRVTLRGVGTAFLSTINQLFGKHIGLQNRLPAHHIWK